MGNVIALGRTMDPKDKAKAKNAKLTMNFLGNSATRWLNRVAREDVSVEE